MPEKRGNTSKLCVGIRHVRRERAKWTRTNINKQLTTDRFSTDAVNIVLCRLVYVIQLGGQVHYTFGGFGKDVDTTSRRNL